MKQEKQAPEELVKEISSVWEDTGFGDGFELSSVMGSKAIESIAKIAMNHAEQENRKLVDGLRRVKAYLQDNKDVLAPFPTRSELDEIKQLLKQYGE